MTEIILPISFENWGFECHWGLSLTQVLKIRLDFQKKRSKTLQLNKQIMSEMALFREKFGWIKLANKLLYVNNF